MGSRKPAIVLVLLLAACRATADVGSHQRPHAVVCDSAEAQRLTQGRGNHADGNPERANRLLRQACTTVLYCGPAHDDLGVLFLEAGMVDDASIECPWARKPAPSHPDPRTNRANLLERAGRSVGALDAYRAALEVAPEVASATRGTPTATLRAERDDPELGRRLDRIARADTTKTWRSWARSRQIPDSSGPMTPGAPSQRQDSDPP